MQALVGIADYGSFSGAADALGTVQSNVSAHVARLERELDAVLVDRASGRLTEEGEVVVERSRRILAELDALVSDVSSLRHEVAGRVRAGMIGTTGRWLVPRLFEHLRLRHPGVHLMVADGTSSTLEPQLVNGQLDLAVVTLPVPTDELATTPLFDEELMLVVPAHHPLVAVGGGDPLPLEALRPLDLLLPARGTTLRDEIDAVAAAAGVELRAAMELDGLRLIASLVFDGYGPALLPASAVPTHLRHRFRLLAIEGMPRRRVGVAMRRHGRPSAPTRAVIELLGEVIGHSAHLPDGLHPAVELAASA